MYIWLLVSNGETHYIFSRFCDKDGINFNVNLDKYGLWNLSIENLLYKLWEISILRVFYIILFYLF